MSDKETKRPIDIIRDSALHMDIGADDDPSPITGFVKCAERFLTVKGSGIYEVQLADQIDPERTNPSVPNAQKRLISYGSDSEFISRSLLTGNVLFNEDYLRKGVSRDRLIPLVLALAIKLAQLHDMAENYVQRENAAVEALGGANEKMKERRSFMIPEVPDVDSLVKHFFIQAKHVLQDLLDIASELFGDELVPGFFNNIESLTKKKYGEDDDLYLFVKKTKPFQEFIKNVRNCTEHEKPKYRAVILNLRMNAAAQIVLPTFELIHPESPHEEIGVKPLLLDVFSNLIDFTESLLVLMVARNIDDTKEGFAAELVRLPEGYQQNPNIRFGFGTMFQGKLVPMG